MATDAGTWAARRYRPRAVLLRGCREIRKCGKDRSVGARERAWTRANKVKSCRGRLQKAHVADSDRETMRRADLRQSPVRQPRTNCRCQCHASLAGSRLGT